MAQQQIHGDASTMDSVYSIKQFVAYISLSFGSFEAAPSYQNTYKLLKTIEIQRGLRFNKGDEASKPLKYSVFYCIIRDRGVPYRNTYNMLKINGFEAAAPCKGKGISAQGKADRRAATPWVPPMTRV